MTSPKIAVILPTLGQKDLVLRFLASIQEQTYPLEKIEVVIVNNSMTGEVTKEIKKWTKKHSRKPTITLIQNRVNLGYVGAANKGIDLAKGDFYFVSNDDVVLEKNCFNNLIKTALNNKKIGILGPRIYCWPQKNKISPQDMPGFESDFFWGKARSLSIKKLTRLKNPLKVDWVSGSGMMIKKEVIEKVGLFDGRLFIFWEDSDLGIRAKKAGFKVVLVPRAKIFHQGSGMMGKITPKKTYYVVRNGLLFLFKHTSWPGKLRLSLFNLGVVLIKLPKVIVGIEKKHDLAYINGIFDFYRGKFGEKK